MAGLHAGLEEGGGAMKQTLKNSVGPNQEQDSWRNEDEIRERIAHLKNLRKVHSRNLRELEKQKAQCGLNPPLAIINGIEHEKEEIARLEQELAYWEQQGKTQNAYPTCSPEALVEAELIALLKKVTSLTVQANVYYVARRPDDIACGKLDALSLTDLIREWSEVRVFSREFELRWRRVRSSYQVWLLTEDRRYIPPTFLDLEGQWEAIPRFDVRKHGIYLWGRYDGSESERAGQATWLEVRIPRPLHYPADPPAEVETDTEKLFARIGHVDYRAPNGAVQFVRLTEVV